MTVGLAPGLVGATVLVASVVASVAATPYSQGPPPSHTGGFGEPTCQVCHVDGKFNDTVGSFTVQGLPPKYVAGEEYELVIRLARPHLSRGGFQLAVRYAEGEMTGGQAGTLSTVGGSQRIVTGPLGVLFAQHTSDGTFAENGEFEWRVTWHTPLENTDPVVVHATAVASNDDDSELGDVVYAGKWRLKSN